MKFRPAPFEYVSHLLTLYQKQLSSCFFQQRLRHRELLEQKTNSKKKEQNQVKHPWSRLDYEDSFNFIFYVKQNNYDV